MKPVETCAKPFWQSVWACMHFLITFLRFSIVNLSSIRFQLEKETVGFLVIFIVYITLLSLSLAVRYIKDPMDYYAECINKCIKGIGTNDERLMQLIVSRCEVLEKGVAS